MRMFTMHRGWDESGVSGIGNVLEGCIFSDGTVVLRWTSEPCSTVVWDSWDDFWTIHVAAHPTNRTVVKFSDGTIIRQEEAA